MTMTRTALPRVAYRLQEVAEMAGVSLSTVERCARATDHTHLRTTTIGGRAVRVTPEDVADWITRQRNAA